jgi:hypothetical protein
MPDDVEYIQRVLRDKALIDMDRTFENSTAVRRSSRLYTALPRMHRPL